MFKNLISKAVIKIGFKKAVRGISRRSPMILAGVGVVGFIGATVTAAKLTPKVNLVIQEKEEDKGSSLTKKEEILTKAKVYLPTILLIVASTLCIGGSTFISHKRNLALSAALLSSQEALKEYKESVVETVGDEVAEEIDTKTVKKKMERSYGPLTIHSKQDFVIDTGLGSDIIYDPLSSTYFTGCRNVIDNAVNHINADLMDSNWIGLNEFYDQIGLKDLGLGDNFGWLYEYCGILKVTLDTTEASWGEPIFVLKYSDDPIYDTRYC